MLTDISSIRPPDDSGTDSLSRYVYQAHVAFPYCVSCALGGDVLSVVPEHIEDIAVERETGWQFIQIKTRDGGRGPWKLSDLTAKDGALRSLLRSHRVLPFEGITLEIHLEGPTKNGDDIDYLRTPEGRSRDEIHSVIKSRLEISSEECACLLERTRLVSDLPSRGSIVDKNLRTLGSQERNLGSGKLESVYRQVLNILVETMAINLDDHRWWHAVFAPNDCTTEEQRKFESKRIDKNRILRVMPEFSSPPKPLLKLVTSRDNSRLTSLEEKLIAGGATEELVADAKSLRAQSAVKEYERLSSSIWGDDSRVDDVRERLRHLTRSKGNIHSKKINPANHIWDDLLAELTANSAVFDLDGVFSQDPFLLLGQVCELADLCHVHWGIADA